MALLSGHGKKGVQLGLLNIKADIEDTEYLSKYFVLNEFHPLFAGGKNSVSFDGSGLLKDKSEIKVECLDFKGHNLYIEAAKSIDAQYTDVSKFVISIHVYEETYNGPGKLVLVGTTKRGEIVRWIGNITIDKTLTNTSKVRFYYKPTLEVRPLLYPVVDTDRASTEYPPPPETKPARAIAQVSSFVNNINIQNGGSGYTFANVILNGGGGSGATATATIVGGQIVSIVVTNGGQNYSFPPTVNISGDGINAYAVSNITRPVSSITLTDPGSGYTFIPDITFVGTGMGASATAVVNDGMVTSITLTSGGDGYIVPPTVLFTVPEHVTAPDLNIPVSFSGSFFTYAADPRPDTNKNTINLKQTDIDYRLVATNIPPEDLLPNTFPYKAFNTQLESSIITLHVKKIRSPFTNIEEITNITSSHIIKRVLDSKTIQLSEPFYSPHGNNLFVSQILDGDFFVDYRFILYNINPDSNKKVQITPDEIVELKDSYAEITYRNIRTFSGRIARHKVYRKGSFTPGEYQLISDELLPSVELLSDPITFNKFYDNIGIFYHQPFIAKYWWPTNNNISLQASSFPINSMKIFSDSFENMTGGTGVMAKLDTVGIVNDNIYRPYDENQYNNLAGESYNSNFIHLKKNTLYELSFNLNLEKPMELPSAVSFYFTSSIASITEEPAFDSLFGLKLGEITSVDKTNKKYFGNTQKLYFYPQEDYFGTLIIVPYRCYPTISNLSLKVYGDHGVSPDVLSIRIPFPVQMANEAYDIKAELLDLDSNVVYSNLYVRQTFDENGESLYSAIQENPINNLIQINNETVIINGDPKFPDLERCTEDIRFVGWHVPIGNPDTDAKLCYTNVSELYIDSDDYIVLSEYQLGIKHTAKSVAVRYNFANNEGRKIYVDIPGNKEEFPGI